MELSEEDIKTINGILLRALNLKMTVPEMLKHDIEELKREGKDNEK